LQTPKIKEILKEKRNKKQIPETKLSLTEEEIEVLEKSMYNSCKMESLYIIDKLIKELDTRKKNLKNDLKNVVTYDELGDVFGKFLKGVERTFYKKPDVREELSANYSASVVKSISKALKKDPMDIIDIVDIDGTLKKKIEKYFDYIDLDEI